MIHMKVTLVVKKQTFEVENILDRVVKPTGGSCMAMIPKEYENRRVKVLILNGDKK